MHVGPVIVERDAPRIGMSSGLEAEPVLDFALLPVHRGQPGGERRKARLVRANRRLQNQIAGLAGLFEDIVVIKDALGGNAIFGEHHYQPGFIHRT
jgi:hypothetical protein